MDLREKVKNIISEKSKLDELISKDIEIGIYNWTIKFCEDNQIIKNWKNKRFVKMYVAKSKSIVANLDTDSYVGNMRLSQRIIDKEFLPHDIANMQRDHVFPEVWRGIIDEYIKKTENAYTEKPVAMSDQIKCGKCHKREVTYIERQCRSADEPMTLLCTCIVCGNRWRIG